MKKRTNAHKGGNVKRYPPDAKEALLARFHTQGLSAEQFSKNEGIPPGTFHGWVIRARKKAMGLSPNKTFAEQGRGPHGRPLNGNGEAPKQSFPLAAIPAREPKVRRSAPELNNSAGEAIMIVIGRKQIIIRDL